MFKAKISLTMHEKTDKWRDDVNRAIIFEQDANGDDIKSTFYRVANVTSFFPVYSKKTRHHTGACTLSLDVGGDATAYEDVQIPLQAMEAIAEATSKFGHPLQGKIIDLRPENQEKIAQDFKNKTGMFAYLKRQAITIK